MTGKTHFAIGIAACAAAHWALSGTGQIPVLPVALGSLLPDIDCPDSAMGKTVPGSRFGRTGRIVVGVLLIGLGLWLQGDQRTRALAYLTCVAGALTVAAGFLDHRGFTHSLLGMALAVAVARCLSPAYWGCIALCYAMHLFADACTPAGIPLLWPLGKRYTLGLIGNRAAYSVVELVACAVAGISLFVKGATFI